MNTEINSNIIFHLRPKHKRVIKLLHEQNRYGTFDEIESIKEIIKSTYLLEEILRNSQGIDISYNIKLLLLSPNWEW